jgi:hypothetical protein
VRILERYGARLPNRWSRSLIAHIRLLVAHTQARDWIDGTPIVYMSVAKTAERLGISPSQVSYNERQLVRLRAITHIDSGNYKRFARRCPDTGRMIEGRGVSLAPLGQQLHFLRQMAAAMEETDARRQRARADYTALRRHIRGVFDALAEGEPWQGRHIDDDRLQDLTSRFEALLAGMRIGRRTDVEAIEDYVTRLTAFMADIAPAELCGGDDGVNTLKPHDNDAELKSRDEEFRRPAVNDCDAHRIQTDLHESNTSSAPASAAGSSSGRPARQSGHGARPDDRQSSRGHAGNGPECGDAAAEASAGGLTDRISLDRFLDGLPADLRRRLPAQAGLLNWRPSAEALIRCRPRASVMTSPLPRSRRRSPSSAKAACRSCQPAASRRAASSAGNRSFT